MLQILSIICFTLLIRNALLLKYVEPVGYVIDLSSMFPFGFYLGLIFCYFVASLLVLNNKLIGSVIFCINHIQILLIPYMLGYYSMGRSDDMSYIGEYLQIANSGSIASWDIYPSSHIIASCLSIVSNLDANLTSHIIYIIFSFSFIIGIYLFSREVLPQLHIKYLVLSSSFILYLGTYTFSIAPHALFFSFMPLYLFTMLKCSNTKNNSLFLSLIFILMILIIPYTHPFILFCLITIFIFHIVFNIPSVQRIKSLNIPPISLQLFLILFVSFLSWLIYNEILMENLQRSYMLFLNKVTDPVFFETTEKLSKIEYGLSDYIELFLFFYGRYIFPTFFILVGFVVIYLNKHTHNEKNIFSEYPNFLYLIFIYILFLFIQLILLFNPVISHTPYRIINLNFILYGQIPLFAISIYELFCSNKSKSFLTICLACLILTLIFSFSLFGCLSGPRIGYPSWATTHNEIQGMKWFYDLRNEEAVASVPLSQIYRFHDILYGHSDTGVKGAIKYFPDHFGYSDSIYPTLAELNFKQYKYFYVIILSYDELLYQEISSYAAVGRYNKSDFARLRNDVSVNKIYSSTNIEIFISRFRTQPQ